MRTKHSKAKRLATNLPVPQSRDECDTMIRDLGSTRRDLQRIEADMNDRIARIKHDFEAKAAPLRDHADALLGGIETWCAANRDQITAGGKVKFYRFGNGEVKWRLRPAKVTIRGKSDVLSALASLGLHQFVRVTEDVNKDAILDDPDAVKGVKGISVGSEGEDFTVEPFEAALSSASPSAKKRAA